MTSKKRNVSIALSPGLIRRLDKAAKALGYSRSALVEELVSGGLAESDMLVSALADDKVRQAFAKAMTSPGVAQAMGRALGMELDAAATQQMLKFFKAGEDAIK